MSVVLVFVSVVCLLYFIQSKYKLYVTGSKLKGPWFVPLIGNVQMISKLRPEYIFLNITEHRSLFRESFRLWLGPQLWVFLHTPGETKDALTDPTLVKADTFQQLHVLIGNGLLISHGRYWETHRRALGPAFHPNILNTFGPVISQHADRLVQRLHATKAQPIEIHEHLFRCVLDTIIETSMGKKLNTQDDDNCVYTHAFHEISECLFERMVNPLLAPDFIFQRTGMYKRLQRSLDIVHNLMETVIRERSELLKQCDHMDNAAEVDGTKKRRTLLDTLLTADIDGRSLSFKEIRDEVNTFVFAGVDTTTAAMAFMLYALGKYPAEQTKLRNEIDSMLPADSSGEFSVAEINSFEYLDMFIKECLRYYTIVPMTGRQTTTDTTIGNIRYCAGVTLWINMYGLAHDDEYFEEPYEFRPQRFSVEQQKQMQPFSYIPFSGGPHVCIGRKYSLLIMKILTVKILKSFKIKLSNPDEKLVLMAQMVLKSLHGINIKFEPIN